MGPPRPDREGLAHVFDSLKSILLVVDDLRHTAARPLRPRQPRQAAPRGQDLPPPADVGDSPKSGPDSTS
jgi:hypothetical protein